MNLLLMAQQPGATGSSGGSMFMTLLPFLLIIVVIYFLMIRPQQKKQKEHQRMLSELKKGDKIITTGGMYATVFGFSDEQNKVILKISDEVKMEFLKSAIAQKVT